MRNRLAFEFFFYCDALRCNAKGAVRCDAVRCGVLCGAARRDAVTPNKNQKSGDQEMVTKTFHHGVTHSIVCDRRIFFCSLEKFRLCNIILFG